MHAGARAPWAGRHGCEFEGLGHVAEARTIERPASHPRGGGRDRHRALSGGLARVHRVLGAGRYRISSVLHPLHPQRQPCLDRGGRALRADGRDFHRWGDGDATQLAHRRGTASELPAAVGFARGAGGGRSPHVGVPRAARLLLGADR